MCGKQFIATFRSKEVRMRDTPQNNMADSDREQDGLSDDDEDILLLLLLIRRRRKRLRAANRQL